MTEKPIVLQRLAKVDYESILIHLYREAGEDVAFAFIEELEAAYKQLVAFPGSGSSRYADILQIPDLRSWALQRFPYLIFYCNRPDYIDIWRLLHGHRDIPASLLEQIGS